jgi:hypothetical protein
MNALLVFVLNAFVDESDDPMATRRHRLWGFKSSSTLWWQRVGRIFELYNQCTNSRYPDPTSIRPSRCLHWFRQLYISASAKVQKTSCLFGLFGPFSGCRKADKRAEIEQSLHSRSVVTHSERFQVIVHFLQATFIIICKNKNYL